MTKAFLSIAAGATALSYALFKALGSIALFPPQAAREAQIVDEAFWHMLSITVPIFAFVVCVLAYIVLTRRAQSAGEQGVPFHHSKGYLVELAWILLSTVLTFSLAAYGTEEFLELRGDRTADVTVQVKASQWSWEFYYPEQNSYLSDLVLPAGKRTRILLTSEDVVHALWIPAFRLKQDALPGKIVQIYVTPTQPGEYDIICAELCGLDHTQMRAKVKVVEAQEFGKASKTEW